MYSYLYAIIGLSLFQLFYPLILDEIFKKKWFRIDNKDKILSKREVRDKMAKREYIYMLLISIIILIIDIILFVYIEYIYQLNLDLNDPLDIPSFIVMLFVMITIIWIIRYTYQQTRIKCLKRRGRTVSNSTSKSSETIENNKELNEGKIKSTAIEIYSILASLNAIIFAFVFTLTL